MTSNSNADSEGMMVKKKVLPRKPIVQKKVLVEKPPTPKNAWSTSTTTMRKSQA
jgi:hypothetical protein